MPQVLALHKRDTLALDGMCDQDTGPLDGLPRCSQGLEHGTDIVPVHLANLPAERCPAITELVAGVRRASAAGRGVPPAELLELVLIDDDHEVVQRVSLGNVRALPHDAFVALAVADHDEGGEAAVRQSGAEGD